MYSIDRDVLQWLVAGVGALLVLVLLAWWRARRGLVRRVVNASLRLEDRPTAQESRRLDPNLARLERAIERAVLKGGAASRAQSRLGAALEAMPQGVVICGERGEVVFRNAAAAEFTTARHGEALVELAVGDLLDDALEGQQSSRSLDLFGPPRRTLVLSGYSLDDDRRTVGALVVIDDVSERRRLEAVRRDFVSNISHELKTPIGALALLAETLREERDLPVAHRLANRMFVEAHRVGRTIDDLLELSRIEAEESPTREPVAVDLVVAQAVERVRPAAEQAGIPVEVTEASRTLAVIGDRRQLVSAVYNLLDNAVKYSDPGSPVEVRSGLDEGAVEIEVQDHGIGIPGRDLERIFERFYRVDRARSRETGGTGLGLAIVRHVASNHDGQVHVRSREGEGSVFTLQLPATQASLDQAASA